MAVRRISLKLSVDGEREYKQALTDINSEIRKQESALKLVASEYKDNASSMEALTAKHKALLKLYEAQNRKVEAVKAGHDNARKAVDQHRQEMERLNKAIKAQEEALAKAEATEGTSAQEKEKLRQQLEKLRLELETSEGKLATAQRAVNRWETDLNKAKTALNGTAGELKQTDAYLEEASQSADGCAHSMDRLGRESQSTSDQLAGLLQAAGVAKGLKEISEAIDACVKSSIEYESAIAGVAKTTDLSKAQVSQMSEDLLAMSTRIPMAAKDLAGIAESAGQLGISGAGNIKNFTEVMAQLGTATNMSADEAATMLAQFANITQMPTDQYSNLGSTITALGNSSATTESEIVEMAQGVAAAGTAAGMSGADIMSVSAAVSSLGIETQAGATSLTKLIQMIDTAVKTGEGLEKFARVAGQSAIEFGGAWRKDAASALATFVQGLGRVEAQGGVLATTLGELGINEVRLMRTTQSLAGAGDLLTSSLQVGRQAFEENTALAHEASVRYSTTESKVQLLKNSFESLKVTIGDQLKPAFSELAGAGAGLIRWFDEACKKVPWLVPALTGVVTALGAFTAVVVGLPVVLSVASKAMLAFKAAVDVSTGGVTLILSAVIGLITALGTLAASMKKPNEEAERMKVLGESAKKIGEDFAQATRQIDDNKKATLGNIGAAKAYVEQLREIEAAGSGTAESQRMYAAIVDRLRELVPELTIALDENGKVIEQNGQRLEQELEQMERRVELQAYQDKYTEALKAEAEAKVELGDAELTLTESKARLKEVADQLYSGQCLEYEKLQELRAEQRQLGETIYESERAVQASTETLNTASEATAQYSELLKQQTEQTQLAQAESNGLLNTFSAYGEAAPELAQAAMDIQSQIASLNEVFEAAKNKVLEATAQQTTSFQALKTEVKISVADMQATWAQNREFYANYNENLKRLTELGVDEGLVASWADGSVASAGYMQAIINEIDRISGSEEEKGRKTKEFVDGFNADFRRTEKARDVFAENCARSTKDFRQAADKINRDLNQLVRNMDKTGAASAEGRNTAMGWVQGIESQIGRAEEMGRALAAAAHRGYRSMGEIKSPSRRARREGGYTAAGWLLGMEAHLKDLAKAGQKAAEAAFTGYGEEARRLQARAVAPLPTVHDYSRHSTSNTTDNRQTSNVVNVTINGAGSDTDYQALADKVGRIFRERLVV